MVSIMAAEISVAKLKIEPEDKPKDKPLLIIRHENHPAFPHTPVAFFLLWKMHQYTLLQQVKVKEQSVEIALPQLQELKSGLSKYIDSISFVNKRIKVVSK